MILVPIIMLLVGVGIGLAINYPLTGIYGQYLAVACVAGLDTVCGGVRSGLEGKFHVDVFVSGFFSNVVIAFFLAWLGDKIFLDLYFVVALVLGGRIFTNLSLIRRYLLTRMRDAQERKRLEAAAVSSQASASAVPMETI